MVLIEAFRRRSETAKARRKNCGHRGKTALNCGPMKVSIIVPGLIGWALAFQAGGAAQAGPCTADIAQFEATVRQSGGDPDAGLTADQSVGAQLGHQPTPSSVRHAETRLQSKFSARMRRAKRLDAQGNPGCISALKAAEQMYIP